jgi:hypothetical protein
MTGILFSIYFNKCGNPGVIDYTGYTSKRTEEFKNGIFFVAFPNWGGTRKVTKRVWLAASPEALGRDL